LSRISLTIPFDTALCESCREEIWVGWERCPHCDAAREPGTKDAAHLYRARVDIFEPLVQASQEVNPTGTVPVTDTQYVRYINGSMVFDAEQLEDGVEALNVLALEDVESTRSIDTRQAAQRLVRSAQRCRRVLTDLKVIKPSGKFAEAHPPVISAFEGFQRMILEIAQGLTAWHPRDAHTHAAGAQESLDDATEELSLASQRLQEAAEDIQLEDSLEDRIASLLGDRTRGEVRTLSDLTGVGVGDFQDFMARGPEGYRYFSDLLHTPLEELPDEVPPVLYILALLVNSFDDPAGIRSRASLFLDVLQKAHAKDKEAMLEAAVQVQDSLGEAGAMLVSVGPLVEALLQTPGVSDDALRTLLLDTYKNLTEGGFRHVANLFLFALFLQTGSPKSWEDIANWTTFGEKHQWLTNWEDEPAITAALEGVEMIVRNSDAHCTYEHLEGGVRLVHTNFRQHTKTERVLDDEELGDLVTDLMRTVLSLSVAAQLFQTDHMGEISTELYEVSTHRALRPTFLQLFLGIFGLVNPSVKVEGSKIEVRASVAEYLTLSPVEEYLKSLFFIGTLYRESEEVELVVEHRSEWHTSIRAPVERLWAVIRNASPATILALLLSAEVSSAETRARTDDEKLQQIALAVGSRLLVHHLVTEVKPLFFSVDSKAADSLRRAVEMLDEFKKALLIPSEIGEDFKRQRDRFISAVDDIRRFIVTNHRVRIGVLKDAQAITRAQRHYQSGASAINEIASTSAVPNQLY
jgi:hypothetical protein